MRSRACQSAFDDALAAPDADGFFKALDNARLWGGPWAEQLAHMPDGLRILRLSDLLQWSIKYPVELLEWQMFAEYGLELRRWLTEHGATEAARCVNDLLEVFPGGEPIVDAERRAEYLSEFESEHPHRYDEIASEYKTIAENLLPPLRSMLREQGPVLARSCDALRAEFAEPLPLTLSEIVAIPDQTEFRKALVQWLDAPTGKPAIGFDRQPEIGKRLWVLEALLTSVEVDGIGHFLSSAGVGASFGKLPAWTVGIDAPITKQYVTAAASRLKELNGGRLPPMKDGARQAAIRRLEARDEATGSRGPFEAVDEQFAQIASVELATKVRLYVETHRADIEREVLENAARYRSH